MSTSKKCVNIDKKSATNYVKKDNLPPKRPRKIIPSKNLEVKDSKEVKSCSTSKVGQRGLAPSKPKKTTRSDSYFGQNNKRPQDLCKQCGDTNDKSKSLDHNALKSCPQPTRIQKNLTTVKTQQNIQMKTKNRNLVITSNEIKRNIVQEFYKNKNFLPSSNSIHDIESIFKKSTHLDTIKEQSESATEIRDFTDGDAIKLVSNENDNEDIGLADNPEVLNDIKEFRKNNYFECHSSKTRLKSTGSVTTLGDHKCVYRFYLNERLFPVPLSTDHNGTVRCVECHLPADLDDSDDTTNGTIQAKVKIGKENENMTLLLPVKMPLLVKERRKKTGIDNDVMYFGVIKLNGDKNDVFKDVYANNSLALRYEKGFKKHANIEKCNYECVQENDVVIV